MSPRAADQRDVGASSFKPPAATWFSTPDWHFKGSVTRRINKHRGTPGAPVWQSRFHDRILRNEREWRARRTYIERNPGRWAEDRYHPDA
jgi:hypothetical protein